MGNCCNNSIHLSMDDTFIQWNEILGDPSLSTSLVSFVDQKIAGIGTSIEDELNAKFDALKNELLEEVQGDMGQIVLDIDPYKINYKNTTVGDALDKLEHADFKCKIGEYGPYEVGQKFTDFNISWTCSENPQTLRITRIRDGAIVEQLSLVTDVRNYVFHNVQSDELFIVSGKKPNGECFESHTKVEFKRRWYFSSFGFTNPNNDNIINWNSEFVDKNTDLGRHIFNCNSGEYIYLAVPEDLHLTYDFFANGMLDTNWVYEIKNVTNQYGSVHPYRIYRTVNLLHGHNIYIEVESHDWY